MGNVVVIHVHPDPTVHNKKYTYTFNCDSTCSNVSAKNISVGFMNPWKVFGKSPAYPALVNGAEINVFSKGFSMPVPDPCGGATIVVQYDYLKPIYGIIASAGRYPYNAPSAEFCPLHGYASYDGDLREKRPIAYDDHGNPTEYEYFGCYKGRSVAVELLGTSPVAGIAIDYGPPGGGPLQIPTPPTNMKGYYPYLAIDYGNPESVVLIGRQQANMTRITQSKEYIYDYERNEDGSIKYITDEQGNQKSIPIYRTYNYSGPAVSFSRVASDIKVKLCAIENPPYVRQRGTGIVATEHASGEVLGVDIYNVTNGSVGTSIWSMEDWHGSYQLNAFKDYGSTTLMGSGEITIGPKVNTTIIKLEELFFSNAQIIPAFETVLVDADGNTINPDDIMDPPPIRNGGDMGSGPEPEPDTYVGPVYVEAQGFDLAVKSMTIEDGKKLVVEMALSTIGMLQYMIGFAAEVYLNSRGAPRFGTYGVGKFFRVVKSTNYAWRNVRKGGFIGKIFKFTLEQKSVKVVTYRTVDVTSNGIIADIARINAGMAHGGLLGKPQFARLLQQLTNITGATISQVQYGMMRANHNVKMEEDPQDKLDPNYVESASSLESIAFTNDENVAGIDEGHYNLIVAVIKFEDKSEETEPKEDVPFEVPKPKDPNNPTDPFTDPGDGDGENTNPWDPAPVIPDTDCYHTVTEDGLTIEDMPFPEVEDVPPGPKVKKKYAYKVISQADVVGDLEQLVMPLYSVPGEVSGEEGDTVTIPCTPNVMEVDGQQYTAVPAMAVFTLNPDGTAGNITARIIGDHIEVDMGGATSGSTLVVMGMLAGMEYNNGGLLKVQVEPLGIQPNIKVYYDGDVVEEVNSDVLIVGFSPGAFRVVVTANGFLTTTVDTEIEKDKTTVLKIHLNKPKNRATIKIYSNVPQAQITVNDIVRGITPKSTSDPYVFIEPFNGTMHYVVKLSKTVAGVYYYGWTVITVDEYSPMPVSKKITLRPGIIGRQT